MPHPPSMTAGLLVHYETEKLCLPVLPDYGQVQDASTVTEYGSLPVVQFGSWLLEQLQPGAPQNVICRAFTIRGWLAEDRLQGAFRALVDDNPILRLRFNQTGEAQSELLPVDQFRVAIVDLRRMSPSDQDEAIQATCEDEHRRKFDLERGPLIRAKWLLRSDTDGVFLLTCHRTITDDWSLAPMVSRIVEVLDSGAMVFRKSAEEYHFGRESVLVPTEDRKQSNSNGSADCANWPPLELPRNGRSSLSNESEGALCECSLDAGCISLLHAASQSLDEHPAALFLAAFQTLLGHMSFSDDIAVGVRLHHRSAENARAIGPYACLVPVRISLAEHSPKEHSTFRSVVGRIKEACTEAETFPDSTLAGLFERCARQRGLPQRVFQSGFTYTEKVPERLRFSDLTWGSLPIRKFWLQHELELRVVAKPGGYLCTLAYDQCLFVPETVRCIGDLYPRLLRSACSEPDRDIADYELLTAVEREQILVARNLSTSSSRSKRNVLEEIERRGEVAADVVAASCGADHLSYGALHATSSHLGETLASTGVAEGSCVALCGPRNLEMLVAMLGIMKAGAVYLPLDPAYPNAQIEFMLKNSRPVLLLVAAAVAERFKRAQVRTLLLEDTIVAARDRTGHTSPSWTSQPGPSNFAYVMYTSGSTGTPKGVIIAHAGMWNHVWAKVCDLNLAASDVVAQTASCSFDISVWQFLSPLVAGARVEIVAADDAGDAALLVEGLRRLSITVWETVPVLLGLIINHQKQRSWRDRPLPALRIVVSNAEALTSDMAREWQQIYPHTLLLNTYGATEASDDTNHFWIDENWIDQNFAASTVHVPLGKPIGESKIYLLDRNFSPVPAYIPGEIYLGGPGVAPGYVNAPALTAERFLPDCFSTRPGDRMYRTGDRGRWLHNGDLEFLGRMDRQIKIRGHRVEPDEVASVLRAHVTVEQAAVIAVYDDGDTSLAAFVAWREKEQGDTSALRSFLKARVPEYMMPVTIVEVPTLPLTPNGKLDTRALQRLLRADSHVAPKTATEGILAEIFEEILAVDRIGMESDFFACGGTMFKAVQLAARIRQVLEIEIPVRLVFESPTIAALAQSIATFQDSAVEPALSADANFDLVDQVLKDAGNLL